MPLFRHSKTIAILAAYAFQAVGWQVAHQWHHSVSQIACSTHVESSDCGQAEHNHHGCHDQEVHGASTHDTAGHHLTDSKSTPGEHKHNHDSSDCWTCHFLSQAASRAQTTQIMPLGTIMVSKTLDIPAVAPSSYQSVLRARGPPAFLLHWS